MMRAMVMIKPGGPEVLEMREVATPCIRRPHEVLVRLRAAGVNPIDVKLRAKGTYAESRQASILGCDGAGAVEEVGDAVNKFRPGDAVYYCYGGIGLTPGNDAEYALAPEYAIAKKPASIGFAEAAAAPLVLITAWESLFDRARVQTGQKVFIHAGAGGVGHVAIQLAKIAGCEIATSVSTEEKAAFVRKLGATLVVNYKRQDVAEALLRWTKGCGVDAAFDTVGGEAFSQLIPAVRIYGDLVTILQIPEDADWQTMRLRNIRVSQELMLTPMIYALKPGLAHQAGILSQCNAWFDEGRLGVHVSRTLPLEQAGQAHRLVEAGGMTGKIVLEM